MRKTVTTITCDVCGEKLLKEYPVGVDPIYSVGGLGVPSTGTVMVDVFVPGKAGRTQKADVCGAKCARAFLCSFVSRWKTEDGD